MKISPARSDRVIDWLDLLYNKNNTIKVMRILGQVRKNNSMKRKFHFVIFSTVLFRQATISKKLLFTGHDFK